MRWPGRRARMRSEYPESFVRRWMAVNLPSSTPAEAASAVGHLRRQGWSERRLAELILPYMPHQAAPHARPPAPDARPPAPDARPAAPDARPAAPEAAAQPDPEISLPADVTPAWLDRHLPALDRHGLRLVVDALEHRGWPPGRVATIVLPHLLPRLPAEDARAVVAGLAKLGLSEEEIARATTPRIKPSSP